MGASTLVADARIDQAVEDVHDEVDSDDDDAEDIPRDRTSRVRERNPKRAHPKDEKAAVGALEEFGVLGAHIEPRLWNGEVHMGVQDAWGLLSRYPGLGEVPTAMYCKGSRWLPSQSMAWNRQVHFQPARTISLDDVQARSYLAGEVLSDASLPCHAEQRGWTVAQWRNASLGWIKGAGNRWNNHLPVWATQRVTVS